MATVDAIVRRNQTPTPDRCAYCHNDIVIADVVTVHIERRYPHANEKYWFCSKLHAAAYLQFDDAVNKLCREEEVQVAEDYSDE